MLRYSVLAATILCAGCPKTNGTHTTLPTNNNAPMVVEVPTDIDVRVFRNVARQLRAAPQNAQGRSEARAALIAYLEQRCDETLDANPEHAWTFLEAGLELYEPEELRPGQLDPALGRMASAMLDVFEPRGDEARTLTALLTLSLSTSETEAHQVRYQRISQWSDEARQSLPTDAERVIGLIQIYQRVAFTIPVDGPVHSLAELYLERHSLLRSTFGGSTGLGQLLLSPRSSGALQSLLATRGRTVEDLIALHIRAGAADEVEDIVAAVAPLSHRDQRLVDAVGNLDSQRRGARAHAELAATLSTEHPGISLRLCHQGSRIYPTDSRFSLCLANLYRELGDTEGAFEYYEANLRNDTSIESFEEALAFMASELEAQLAADDPMVGRETFARAERVLTAFEEHHPGREPPIREDQLSYLVGMGEYNAGNIAEAVERLQASVQLRQSRPALLQLGIIAERQGRHEEAVRYYRSALDLREGTSENPLSRAVVLEHLAEAYEMAGTADRANVLYNETLEMLRVALHTLPSEAGPVIRMERGFVFHRLGRTADAAQELQVALAAAPQRQATYGRLLSFYIEQGMLEEALGVYRVAFNHSDLNRIWKIYYSMWVVGLALRLGEEPDTEAIRYLGSIEGDGWLVRLGRCYAGSLEFQQLEADAQTRRQQAEAYYYQAVRRLAQGQRAEAETMLQQVLDTNMMSYPEYDFARRLQAELRASSPSPTAQQDR